MNAQTLHDNNQYQNMQFDIRSTHPTKGQLISEWLLDVFIWTKKTNENISVFLPYHSKIGQIKKRMQIIILEDK